LIAARSPSTLDDQQLAGLVRWMPSGLAHEAKGQGVPEVMLAVAKRGGRIRPAVVLIKAVASAVCQAAQRRQRRDRRWPEDGAEP
jgi:hypothetical protein